MKFASLVGILSFVLSGCTPRPRDEANLAGLTPADFPQLTADVFQQMDGGLVLTADEIKGRNTWNLWTGGNQHFWNAAAEDSFGLVDLLKTLDNRKYKRGDRFKTLGLVNQPGFHAATKPDELGLLLDLPDDPAKPEPTEINSAIYGRPSGVLGFRLFPNPQFDAAALRNWDGDRFINDPSYYNDRKLVRPFRVGVSCGACHIAPHPDYPPEDPEKPEWKNLASAIGNQYIREGKVFASNVSKGSFFYEMLQAQPPGTSDTSRIATDHINNPNAINAIFLLAERERIASPEKLSGGALDLPGTRPEMPVPHILKDGADSIGFAGAMLRVYVNIGMFSEYWLTRHDRLIGWARGQRPFEIKYARENSVFWLATEERTSNVAAFFRRLRPYLLADAPGGNAFITSDSTIKMRGRQVFGENCASCHSSKQPAGINPRTPDGKTWFRDQITRKEFWQDNFLSNERRIPLTELKTNAARALGTNATAGHIWDNFSSQTYKELKPLDKLEFFNPFNQTQTIKFSPKERKTGPGYYRVPSLVSLWSSAPFLHNNSLGEFDGDPSVAGRLRAFDDAAEKLLWPEKRLGKASIRRTQEECHLHLAKQFVPESLRKLADELGYIRIGPIPKGTPINLIANLEPNPEQWLTLKVSLGKALAAIKLRDLSSTEARDELLMSVDGLLAANKCPDFVEDEGHYFGTDLVDEDKRALIEFLKTL